MVNLACSHSLPPFLPPPLFLPSFPLAPSSLLLFCFFVFCLVISLFLYVYFKMRMNISGWMSSNYDLELFALGRIQNIYMISKLWSIKLWLIKWHLKHQTIMSFRKEGGTLPIFNKSFLHFKILGLISRRNI